MITKDMLISEILEQNEDIANVLMRAGMHCVGCMAAAGETLDEACDVHGIDSDTLVSQINEVFG